MSQSHRQSMFRELRVYERALHKEDIHFTYLPKMPLVHLHVHMHIYIYIYIYMLLHAFSYDVTCKKGSEVPMWKGICRDSGGSVEAMAFMENPLARMQHV